MKTSLQLLVCISILLLIGCERKPDMSERKGVITFKGGPLTLLGAPVNVGSVAPDFEALGNDLSSVRLSSFKGKVVVVSAVPSLDTPVCDTQTRKFNEEAGKLGDGVKVLTISMDLPFAQKRWCGAAGVNNVITLSDHREGAFGFSYGLLIKELRLLARSVIVVDKLGVIRYIQIVPEVTQEPDYEAALAEVRKLI